MTWTLDIASHDATREADAGTAHEALRFLELEADILDAADFESWAELWEPDGCYWIPTSREHTDPTEFVSLVFDDRAALDRRIARVSSRLAYALQPVAQVSRLIGNVRVAHRDDGLLQASSRFVLMLSRRGHAEVFAGRMNHLLRRRSNGLGIVLKRLDIVGADRAFENFTVVF